VTRLWRETRETERLLLRPLSMSDAVPLHVLQQDERMMRYFGGPYLREQTQTWLEWHVAIWEQEGYSHWAADLKQDGSFVGWIGLTKIWEPEELASAVEVGWFVDRRHWGKGLASEGGRESLRFGFQNLALDRVLARYNPENAASGRVMEKIGMHHLVDMTREGEGVSRIYEIRRGEMA
jgi:RimJ/RimL family protein N-acetyltransferase